MKRSLHFLTLGSSALVIFLVGWVTQANAQIFQQGDRGSTVELIQDALRITVDGVYGSDTTSAVRSFQQRQGLSCVDGVVGPETLRALGLSRLITDPAQPCGGGYGSLSGSGSSRTLAQLAGADPNGNYEVIIPGNTFGGSIEQLRTRVEQVVPGASFRASSRGSAVRAGRYDSRSGAEAVSELLRANGFDARVEYR